MIPRPDIDPRMLARALRPGRVRGIALELLTDILANPHHASATLRRGLREARALHSRERRFTGDVLNDLIRWGPLLDGATHHATPQARWFGWLAHLGAEEIDAAWESEWGDMPTWDRCRNLADTLANAAPEQHDAWLTGTSIEGGRALRRALGDELPAFIEASNQRARIGVRLPRSANRDALVQRIRSKDIDVRASTWLDHAITLPPSSDLRALRLPQGWSIQDEASQLVAETVQVQPTDRVLDVCAGAGGKTLALGAALTTGQLVAGDIRPRALDQLRKRARQAKVAVEVHRWNDDGPNDDLGLFDRVLVDAPCTGTGVWRRHPDHRFRLADLDATTALQDQILHRASQRVRPGGRLVFATCSVLVEEGDDRVHAFLAGHPEFQPAEPGVPPEVCERGALRTSPHRHGTDGFFAAAFLRAG